MFAVVIAVILLVLSFYLLAVVSEDFFVPAIDTLAHKLRLSSDAAGATLLAIGSSAPELFTSVFAVFGSHGNNSDVGAGTIIGSAIFNILVIIGASATFKAVHLQWKPVIRDMMFYIVTIIALFVSFRDGVITLTEAITFFAGYIVYVVAVINWRKIANYEDNAPDVTPVDEPSTESGVSALVKKTVGFVIPCPSKKPQLYMLTFMLSIGAIAFLSHLLVDNVVIIANYFSINATFLALTVLAAGTSIPDLLGSIIVAKQGRGDMAVSNAVGSNIFDILFGLGLPWTIYMLINGGSITVSNDNLEASIFLLFATVVSLLFLMISRNWRLGRRSGFILIGLYLAYIAYVLVSLV